MSNDSLEFAINQLYRTESRDGGLAIISNYDQQVVHFVEHNKTFVNAADEAMGRARIWMRRDVEPVHRSIHGYPGRDEDLDRTHWG